MPTIRMSACRRSVFGTLAFISLALGGCEEKQVDVVKPFRSQYLAFQKQLAEMAVQEPEAPVRIIEPLDPKPQSYEPKPIPAATDPKSNTAIFQFEQYL